MSTSFVFPRPQDMYALHALQFTSWSARSRGKFSSPFLSSPAALLPTYYHGEYQMMNKKVTDRRISRTRRSLQDALVALILEKGFEKVTVQDIIDHANVGRSTFYAHFQSIDDLLLSQFEEVQQRFDQHLRGQAAADEHPWELTLLMFQHAQSQHPLYKALFGGRGGNIMLAHINRYFSELIKEHLIRQLTDRKDKVPSEILVHYIVSSMMALLIWWLDHDLPYTAEQMNNMFRELTEHGLESVLEQSENAVA